MSDRDLSWALLGGKKHKNATWYVRVLTITMFSCLRRNTAREETETSRKENKPPPPLTQPPQPPPRPGRNKYMKIHGYICGVNNDQAKANEHGIAICLMRQTVCHESNITDTKANERHLAHTTHWYYLRPLTI